MAERVDKRDFHAARQVLMERLDRLEVEAGKVAACITEVDGHLPAYIAKPEDYYKPGHVTAKPEVPNVVRMEHFEGCLARKECADLIEMFKFGESQNRSTTLRLPGFIVASKTTLNAILELNAVKASIEEVIQSKEYFGGADVFRARGKKNSEGVVYEKFGNIHLQQIYRRLIILEAPPAKLMFSWAAHSTTARQHTRESIIAMIEEDRAESPPREFTVGQWNQKLDKERYAIECLPAGEKLVVRKPALQPIANIWMGEKASPTGLQKLSLPLFIPDKPGQPDWTPQFEHMNDLDRTKRRAVRSDATIEVEPLIERLHVFRYRAEHRNGKLPVGEGVLRRDGRHLVVSFSAKNAAQTRTVSLALEMAEIAVPLAKFFMGGSSAFKAQRANDGGSVVMKAESNTYLQITIRSESDRNEIRGLWRFADAKKAFLDTT